MQLQLVFVSIIPIVAYVVARRVADERRAILVAIALSGLELVYNSLQLGYFEMFSLVSFASFLVLGGVSLVRGQSIVFKFQPVVFEFVVAGIFFVNAFFLDTPLLARFLWDEVAMQELLAPFRRGYFEVYTRSLSSSIPFLLVLHASWTAHAALRSSTIRWFHVRVFGLYGMIAVLFLFERIVKVTY